MSESRFYHFPKKGIFYNTGSVAAAIAAVKEGGFIWLNFFEPSKVELASLVEPLGIHPLSVEDCMDEKQVPKLEHFPQNTFLIFNSFSYSDKTLKIDEVDMFIGENFLITVSGYHSDNRKPIYGLEGIIELEFENARKGPAFLMHVIMDHIVDQKYHAIEAMEDELEEAEEDLLSSPGTFNPAELVRLRRYLLNLRKSLFHEREILVKICRMDSVFIGEKAIFHFRDIYDHLAKFLELTETYREIVTSLMELYTSLLNNLMTKASNETNFSVRRLTLITTIFMPLTLLASIGGMSEWSMITGSENWRIAYPLFLLGMVLIGVVNFWLIRRLDRRSRANMESELKTEKQTDQST
jgi:magnesium transporter